MERLLWGPLAPVTDRALATGLPVLLLAPLLPAPAASPLPPPPRGDSCGCCWTKNCCCIGCSCGICRGAGGCWGDCLRLPCSPRGLLCSLLLAPGPPPPLLLLARLPTSRPSPPPPPPPSGERQRCSPVLRRLRTLLGGAPAASTWSAVARRLDSAEQYISSAVERPPLPPTTCSPAARQLPPPTSCSPVARRLPPVMLSRRCCWRASTAASAAASSAMKAASTPAAPAAAAYSCCCRAAAAAACC